MANHKFPVSKGTWLEELCALARTNDIYVRLLFVRGHILAKPSRILADGRTIPLRPPPSALSGSDTTELWMTLPDEPMALYGKTVDAQGAICLSIIYRLMERDGTLRRIERIHLSNSEELVKCEDSESL